MRLAMAEDALVVDLQVQNSMQQADIGSFDLVLLNGMGISGFQLNLFYIAVWRVTATALLKHLSFSSHFSTFLLVHYRIVGIGQGPFRNTWLSSICRSLQRGR